MSRIFGPITQNGYVVRNLDQAVEHWTKVLGIGPFFVLPPITFDSYVYNGEASSPEIRVAMANSGSLQIELIQQTNDAPSSYLDFLINSGPGLQHLSVWSENYDDDMLRFRSMGLKVSSEGRLTNGPRFTYYSTDLHNGCMMEVMDLLAPPAKELYKVIHDAAQDWDGSNPIRHIEIPET